MYANTNAYLACVVKKIGVLTSSIQARTLRTLKHVTLVVDYYYCSHQHMLNHETERKRNLSATTCDSSLLDCKPVVPTVSFEYDHFNRSMCL